MYYVEFLRARKRLIWFSLATALVSLLTVIIALTPGNHVQGGDTDTVHIPLSILIGIAGFVTWILASILGLCLNGENDGPEIVFTKPFSRERIALAYYAVDALVIVVSLAIFCLFLTIIPLASVHLVGKIFFDKDVFAVIGLMLGVAFMWYGLVAALTAWGSFRGGLVAGLGWPVAAVLVALGHTCLPPEF